jgi:hypothetical protein
MLHISSTSLILSLVKGSRNPATFIQSVGYCDRLCGLVIRVLGYRSGGPVSIPDTTKKKKVVGLERVHSAS